MNKVLVVSIVISVIALALAGLSYTESSRVNTVVKDLEGNWRCSQVTCTRFMTPEEWIARFCFLNATNEMNCNVNINGVPTVIPLSVINTSAIYQCAEYACVEEVRVRSANYTLNITG